MKKELEHKFSQGFVEDMKYLISECIEERVTDCDFSFGTDDAYVNVHLSFDASKTAAGAEQ